MKRTEGSGAHEISSINRLLSLGGALWIRDRNKGVEVGSLHPLDPFRGGHAREDFKHELSPKRCRRESQRLQAQGSEFAREKRAQDGILGRDAMDLVDERHARIPVFEFTAGWHAEKC